MRRLIRMVLAGLLAAALCLGSFTWAEETGAETDEPAMADEEAQEAETEEEEETAPEEEDDGADWKACEGETIDMAYRGTQTEEKEGGSLEIPAAPFEIYQYTGPRAEGYNAFTVLDEARKVIAVIPYPVSSKEIPACICPKGTAWLAVSIGEDVAWDWSELGMDMEEEETEDPDAAEAILWKRNTRFTLSVMGDSISTFTGYLPEGNAVYYNGEACGITHAAQMWWGIAAKELGCRISTIDAWSASRVTTTAGEEAAMCMGRTTRLAENGTPDAIIVFGGVNDYNKEVPIGIWAGKGTIPATGETFREAYAMMLDKIHQAYPMARVYCCTLAACELDAVPVDLENLGGQYLHEFNEAIREIARIMNCEVIELNSCGINSYNLQAYMGDYDEINHWALHPNAAGQKLIAESVIEALR